MNSTEPPSPTALVTGGAGFIGHRLVRGLLQHGWSVVILDDLSTGNAKTVPDDARVRFVKGSILDASVLAAALRGVDAVFHLAAQVSVPESVSNPERTHRINILGMESVLDAARAGGVRGVVFTSSCSVYGDPAVMPVCESTDLEPMSPYADSKLAGERLGYARCDGRTGFAALRLFNVYGPGQEAGGAYAAVIAAFAGAAARGEGPTIFGDGLQTRDFVHVDDVVSALIATALHVMEHGSAGPFNVGTGRAVTLLELWQTLAEVMKSPNAPIHAPERTGDILHSRADVGAIERELGWTATMSLLDGLTTTFGP